ncbi:FAD-binding protein [Plantactinospora solaniradicis]|uniref:FAD-binding protein n=1 Tax=Plantactinospora solaniradicis TaxID=1723736 RepID=A0ABW1KAJ2_9ACTN
MCTMTKVGEMGMQRRGSADIARRLAGICGTRFARPAGAADDVAGAMARWVAAPGTPAAATEVVRLAAEYDLSVVARGAGTKLDWGATPSQVDIVLDTGRLAGVWHRPADGLVAEIGAGTPVRAAEAILERAGLRLPIDAPSVGATIGGVVAAGESGPLRYLHGTACDQLVGVSFVDASGVLARAGTAADVPPRGGGGAGGRPVDREITQLLCGSQGALGVLVSTTLRVQPIPASRVWVSRSVWTPLEVHDLVRGILAADLRPTAIEVDLPAARGMPAGRIHRSGSSGGHLPASGSGERLPAGGSGGAPPAADPGSGRPPPGGHPLFGGPDVPGGGPDVPGGGPDVPGGGPDVPGGGADVPGGGPGIPGGGAEVPGGGPGVPGGAGIPGGGGGGLGDRGWFGTADRPGGPSRPGEQGQGRPPGTPGGPGRHARRGDGGSGTLTVLLEGGPAEVAERVTRLTGLLGGDAEGAGVAPEWWRRYPFRPDDVALRIEVPIGDLHAAVYALRDAAGAPIPVRGSAGLGVVHAALPATTPPERVAAILDGVRAVLRARAGRCVVVAAPQAVREAVDLWGELPDLPLLRQVKERFDPAGRLAPGRYPGGI